MRATGTRAGDPLADAAAASAYWQDLPRNDPIAAQGAVSEVLAGVPARDNPAVEELQGLLALDRHAQPLVDALLVSYVAADAGPSTLEQGHGQAAFELCRSFGRAHGHFLRSVRDRQHYRRWREYLPTMLVRLFQHRQVELLLRPFVDERSTRFSWVEVHEAYQYAHLHGMLRETVPVRRAGCNADSTPGQEYVQLLVQGLMNRGNFAPQEAFRAHQEMPRWCEELRLLQQPARGDEDRFVVDLNSDQGLVRSSMESAGARFWLDVAPALALMNDEIASLRESRRPAGDPRASDRSWQLRLLRKASVLLTPTAPRIARRGERTPVAVSVEIVIGLTRVIGALRRKPPSAPAGAPRNVPEIQPSTLTEFGGFTAMRTNGLPGRADEMSSPPAGDFDAGSPLWRLVDRSDSGCRLQGQIFDSTWVVPGTLIAFRENAASPWTLAIVRRVEKQADNRADVGAEYLGRNPRGVKMTVSAHSGKGRAGSPEGETESFGALFLAESATHPVLPVKTLVLPTRKFAADDRLILRSVTTLYTIELKEPLEEQRDFLWAPFDVVARMPRPAVAGEAGAYGT